MTPYRKDPRLNASRLKLFSGSIDLEIARHQDANPEPPSAAMALGSAVHDAIEHAGKFSEAVVISPFKDFRSKAAKEWRELRKHRIILPEVQVEQALTMAHNVMDRAPSWMFCTGAKHEQDFYTEEFKALLDLVTPDKIGVDWKTTSAKSEAEFIRSCYNFGYALQAYHYSLVAELNEFWFVAVSSVAPYPVWAFHCDESFMSYGKQEWERAYDNFNRSELITESQILSLSAPHWAKSSQADEPEDVF